MKRIMKEEKKPSKPKKSKPKEDAVMKEQKMFYLEWFNTNFSKQLNDEFKEHRKMLTHINDTNKKALKNANASLDGCLFMLEQIMKVHEEIQATICNVMLAIKQNSYLQAWYPEQQGIEAGHFSGPHPIVQKRIDEKYSDSDTRCTTRTKKTQTRKKPQG